MQSSAPPGIDPTEIDPRLTAYGLYASQSLKLNDGVKISPWRMGSGGHIFLGVGTHAKAYAFALGDLYSGRESGIFGDVRLGGRYVPQQGALKQGAVDQDPGMQAMLLSLTPVVVDATTSLFVESGQRQTVDARLPYPRDVTVRSNGTLVLVGEEFQFRSLVLNAGAKLVLRKPNPSVNQAMVITVTNQLLVDRALMSGLMDAGPTVGQDLDARAVLWKYHGTAEIHINGSTRFVGTLVAPYCKVSMSSTAGFQGSLWAREVEIHQYNGTVSFLPYTGDSRSADTDLDGVTDVLEFQLGTDPLLVDTDGDGYTDGLEVHGRQGLMGALKGVTTKSPNYWHSWGWALDTTRRDLFNPLRRDQFLRLVWQKEDEIRSMVGLQERQWNPDSGVCKDVTKYPFVFQGGFAAAWADPAWLDRMVEIFADPQDKPLVDNPHSARVPDYTVALHLDAGPTAWRNLDQGMPKLGGENLVATGGTNTGIGPYDFDLNGDGRLDNFAQTVIEFDCQGDSSSVDIQDERRALTEKLFRGWTTDPFRDSWGIGVGYGANGRGTPHEQSEAPHHTFVTSATSRSSIGLRGVLLHEYGHTLGLNHSWPSSVLVRDGVMNYAFLGGLFQKCHQTRGATFQDTRYCGEEPQADALGLHNSLTGEESPWFNISWMNQFNNAPTISTDQVVFLDGGPVDPRTGFRKVRQTRTNADLRFSQGIYCELDLTAMNEQTGISVCADRRGTALPAPVPGTPIDWNQNGVIDADPVDLWGTNNGADWFLNVNSGGGPWYTTWDTPVHRDENDWRTMLLIREPFIGVAGNATSFLINQLDRRRDLKEVTTW